MNPVLSLFIIFVCVSEVVSLSCDCSAHDNGLSLMSIAMIGVLGLLIIVVTALAIMVVKLSFSNKAPLRRQRPTERNNQRSQRETQHNGGAATVAGSQPVMSALYAEAETPLTKNVTDDASQHYAEAGGAGHYAETQAFSVMDEPKPTHAAKRGGKYGYSTVNKPGKKKATEQAHKSTTLPRHLPSDNVYMPLTEGEYDHLNKPRPKNPSPKASPKGIKLIPYQTVSLRRKKESEVSYDVPPSHKNPQETYDVPPSHTPQNPEAQETYDVPPSQTNSATQETYDVPGSNVPLNDYDAPRNNSAASGQMMYDVPPPSGERGFKGQMTYDRPPLIPSAVSGVYDVPKSQKNSPKSSPKL